MTIIIIYGHQSDQDQVYVNCCQTKTPAATLTTQSRSRWGKNRSSVGTSSFRYNHISKNHPWDSDTDMCKTVLSWVFLLSRPSKNHPWDSDTDMCKTVLSWVFLLSRPRYIYIYCRHYTRKLQKVPSLFLGKLNVILVECHCFIFMQLHLAQSFPHWLKMEHFSKQSQCLDSSTVLHN